MLTILIAIVLLIYFGDGVEVLAPQDLREQIVGKVKRLADRYAGKKGSV